MSNKLALQATQTRAYWDLYNSYKVIRNILKLQTFKYGNTAKVNDLTHLDHKIKNHRKKTIALRDATYALRLAGFEDSEALKKKPQGFDPSEVLPNWLFKYRGSNYYFSDVPNHQDWGGWYQLLHSFSERNKVKYLLAPEICGYNDELIVDLFSKTAREYNPFQGIVSVDLETTSLTPITGEIIEIGIVYWPPGVKDVNKIERFQLRFDLENPEVRKNIGTGPTHIHGIEPEMIAGLPNIAHPEIQKILKKYLCSNNILLIHNGVFEFKWLTTYVDGFYEANMDNFGMQHTLFDTSLLVKGLVEDTKDNKLETLVNHAGYEYKFAHSAMADAMMTLLSAYEVHNHLATHGERMPRLEQPTLNIADYDSLLTVEKTSENLKIHNFS